MTDTVEEEEMTDEFRFQQPDVYEGWTKEEKYNLYLGIRYNGLKVEEIKKRIPEKTEAEIQAVIDYCKEELVQRETEQQKAARRRKRMKLYPQIPLAKWAELLTERYNYKELQTELAPAIRIIADFEDIPHPSKTEKIDFKKIYHFIADAMEGKTLPKDSNSADILNYCVMRTAAMSRGCIPKNQIQSILSSFKNSSLLSGPHILPRPTKDGGTAAIRTLAGKTNYNPMNVPEECLSHMQSYTSKVPDGI